MSRIIVDVSSDQHRMIKAMAATEGKTIKDYVLERVLPEQNSQHNEDIAMEELKYFFLERIKHAKNGEMSDKSITDITKEVLQNIGRT